MQRSFYRGHPLIWEGDKETGQWLFEDTKEPLPSHGGENRPCKKCGANILLGIEVDPCLGQLPGVDNACCGHGEREEAYIRFNNGKVVKGFTVA